MDHHPFCPWWKVKVKVAQSCPTLFNPMVYIYTVHGIHQARILELVAFPFSMGSSQPRDRSQGSCIAGGFFTSWATREARQWWSHYLKIILCLSGCKTPSPNYSGDLLSLHHTLLKKKKKEKNRDVNSLSSIWKFSSPAQRSKRFSSFVLPGSKIPPSALHWRLSHLYLQSASPTSCGEFSISNSSETLVAITTSSCSLPESRVRPEGMNSLIVS